MNEWLTSLKITGLLSPGYQIIRIISSKFATYIILLSGDVVNVLKIIGITEDRLCGLEGSVSNNEIFKFFTKEGARNEWIINRDGY